METPMNDEIAAVVAHIAAGPSALEPELYDDMNPTNRLIPVTVSPALDRCEAAGMQMTAPDHAAIVELLLRVRRCVAGEPHLRAAFACLAVAELMLLDAPDFTADAAFYERFRSFAVEILTGVHLP
jgi:hypothetical protein